MNENITYLPKTKQGLDLSWGQMQAPKNNRFGYDGVISFAFDGDKLCRLDLEANNESKNVSKTLSEKLTTCLISDENSIDMALYGTEFQHQVWTALLKIKSGYTVSYGMIANIIREPKAFRAVGTAVGKNPISLLIPCHRVVNKSGSKVSYLWGGDIKLKILNFESQS